MIYVNTFINNNTYLYIICIKCKKEKYMRRQSQNVNFYLVGITCGVNLIIQWRVLAISVIVFKLPTLNKYEIVQVQLRSGWVVWVSVEWFAKII